VTSNPDERANDVLPQAAALVCAVADEDRDEIARILADVCDWPALAVVLAANIDDTVPIRASSPEKRPLADRIIVAVSRLSGVPAFQIRSDMRDRHIASARSAAMYACHYAGLSYAAIGRAFERDHTTAMYAVARVGEDAKLRELATEAAAACGVTRPADEPDRDEHRRQPREVKCSVCGNRTRRAVGMCTTCENAAAAA
jgi:hypothetical protein